MRATETLLSLLLAACAGLLATVSLERLLRPIPNWSRPVQAWVAHIGIWCCAYGLCALLIRQPWLASGCVLVVLFILVLVNNAKMQSLQEPFIFQDYEYFTDTIRFPRLYLPFFGWKKFFIATASVLLLLFLAWHGPSLPKAPSQQWPQVLGGALAVLAIGTWCLYYTVRHPVIVHFAPERDIRYLGFLPCLWYYGIASRTLPAADAPFSRATGQKISRSEPDVSSNQRQTTLPHLVAVQSESFFDPRNAFPGIRADLLAEYDRLKESARAWGKLYVPAWGANTVRTEFAFLSGIEDVRLGAHRFNPYRAVARGWHVFSLAAYLRSLGYRTICIHPYFSGFYLRDRVLPLLGFDEFWDIKAFSGAKRSGPYISDLSVAEKMMEALGKTNRPLFLFAITMENHGPLHLEKAAVRDIDELYTSPPEDSCDDLTIYLRHLRNANRMIARLRSGMECLGVPAELCWYGDHVPIMPKVYARHGTPPKDVEYVFWSNSQRGEGKIHALDAHDLAMEWWKGAYGEDVTAIS